jgi:hypothetical protein
MEWAQKDMTTRINSFELEDDESEEEEDSERDLKQAKLDSLKKESNAAEKESKDMETKAKEAANGNYDDKEAAQVTFTVTFDQADPTSPSADKEREEKGLLEKGRSCLEKTKHFWPSPAQCIPVRIAG